MVETDWYLQRCCQGVEGVLGSPDYLQADVVAHSTPRIVHVEVVGVVEADVAVVAALEPETGAYACGLDEIQTLTRIASRLTAVVAEWRNPEWLWM